MVYGPAVFLCELLSGLIAVVLYLVLVLVVLTLGPDFDRFGE